VAKAKLVQQPVGWQWPHSVYNNKRRHVGGIHVTSWWFRDTAAARLVVGLSPLRVRWNGTRFHTHSGSLLGVPTASDQLWKLILFAAQRDD